MTYFTWPFPPATSRRLSISTQSFLAAWLRGITTTESLSTSEHRTIVLIDPTGNLFEFKQYRDPRMKY